MVGSKIMLHNVTPLTFPLAAPHARLSVVESARHGYRGHTSHVWCSHVLLVGMSCDVGRLVVMVVGWSSFSGQGSASRVAGSRVC